MRFRIINFPFYIAWRYLFSKKSHNAINVISVIGVCGVALSTMALVCTMAVFSGFQDLVASLFTTFDAPLRIESTTHKSFKATDPSLQAALTNPEIAAAAFTYEEHALLVYQGKQIMVTLKGVDSNFTRVSDVQNILYGEGTYMLQADVLHFGILGMQVAALLGTGVKYPGAIQVYAPRRGERINMVNPTESFKGDELYSPGVVFAVNQSKYDAHYVLTSLDFVRNLFDHPQQATAVEIKPAPDVDISSLQDNLQAKLGPQYQVLDRYAQHEEAFRSMQIEKVMAYFFLLFILLIACFNIVGSLSMLIIDKKDDVNTLRCLGASTRQIKQIFLFEGRFIATIGTIIGVILGVLLCYGQQEFGWIKLGTSQGSFIVDAYPVSILWTDILFVFVTVLILGYLFVWYPVHYLTKKLL